MNKLDEMNKLREQLRLLLGVRSVIWCECPRCGHVIEVRLGARKATAEIAGGDVCRMCEASLEYGEAGLVMAKRKPKVNL